VTLESILNPCLFHCNKWNFNRFLNACLSRLPACSLGPKGNFIQVPASQPPHPFLPFPLYLDTLLLQGSSQVVKLRLHRSFNVVGVRLLLMVIVSRIDDAKETLSQARAVRWSALHATRTRIPVALHSLTCTNQTSRMCPCPCYPSFPRMTWWSQPEPGTAWIRFSSPQSAHESQDAHRTWIISTHRCQTPTQQLVESLYLIQRDRFTRGVGCNEMSVWPTYPTPSTTCHSVLRHLPEATLTLALASARFACKFSLMN
jgi:hypothetical protein